MENNFFLKNYVTSEGSVSHNVLYQMRLYANSYFESLPLHTLFWCLSAFEKDSASVQPPQKIFPFSFLSINTQVTLLLPCFREVDQTTDDAQQVINEINEYNRRFSGEPRPVSRKSVYRHRLQPHLNEAILAMAKGLGHTRMKQCLLGLRA